MKHLRCEWEDNLFNKWFSSVNLIIYDEIFFTKLFQLANLEELVQEFLKSRDTYLGVDTAVGLISNDTQTGLSPMILSHYNYHASHEGSRDSCLFAVMISCSCDLFCQCCWTSVSEINLDKQRKLDHLGLSHLS